MSFFRRPKHYERQIESLGKKGDKKGKETVRLVLKAFGELKNEGKIKDFKHVDKPGKDFYIYPLEGSPLPLEIKSSFFGEVLHEIRYSTPSLVVPLKDQKKLRPAIEKRMIGKIKKDVLALLENRRRMGSDLFL